MKTAIAAFAAAALFLVAVVMGIGQSAPPPEQNLPAIQLRQDRPASTPAPEPSDDTEKDGTEKVERNVDDGDVGDYDDDGGHGRGRGRGGDDDSSGGDDSGHGSDDSGHGGGNSGHGSDDGGGGGDGSGSGSDDDSSGGDR
ncbi:MAG TPA: hypothetical protein VGO89_09655 [Streptomyces sp.]|jgi:hypothetical protein|nr:hypothetical protein [Streptomyces sp.]